MSPHEATQLGQHIRQLREARGMSQAALARAIGVPNTTVNRIESGFIESPSRDKLARLAEALEVDLEELMVHHPTVAAGLPGFEIYLRAKTGMSEEAIAEAAAFMADLEKRDGGPDGKRAE